MLFRMETIENLVRDIAALAPKVSQAYREKLEARVREYLEGANIDEGRLLTEVAAFADRSNIDEELTRLFSHIAQFRSISQEGIVGRKLDFLVPGIQPRSQYHLFQEQRHRDHPSGTCA